MDAIYTLNKRSGSNSLPWPVDSELLQQLKKDFPNYRFVHGKKFAFRPPRTIILGAPEPFYGLLTLHELSHAILGHRTFSLDVERLKMESEAWEKARELALRYDIKIDDDFIQDKLDTYRDWLHLKSKCKKCGLTCYQTDDGTYHCPRCENFV